MTKETYYQVVKVTKGSNGGPEIEEVVFVTPHRSEALVVKDKLNADLCPKERQVLEFRFAQCQLLGGREPVN